MSAGFALSSLTSFSPEDLMPERPANSHKDPDVHLATLLQAIARGDQNAFADFYDLTSRQVFGLVRRILNDSAAAEEVTLDVFMQVWRQARNFEALRGKPVVWLMMIARSRAIDRLRAVTRNRESEPLDSVIQTAAQHDSPEQNSLFAERCRIVREALEQLSTDQRALIETAYYEGLSHAELAAKFKLPLGTVKTRIRIGMNALRKHLTENV
jgi:RNA polymerase sigma-70 factor (ECF subfamily)